MEFRQFLKQTIIFASLYFLILFGLNIILYLLLFSNDVLILVIRSIFIIDFFNIYLIIAYGFTVSFSIVISSFIIKNRNLIILSSIIVMSLTIISGLLINGGIGNSIEIIITIVTVAIISGLLTSYSEELINSYNKTFESMS